MFFLRQNDGTARVTGFIGMTSASSALTHNNPTRLQDITLESTTRRTRLLRYGPPSLVQVPANDPTPPNVAALSTAPTMTLVLLPGPTTQDHLQLQAFLSTLMPLFGAHNDCILRVEWIRSWKPKGQERFAPLLRDLNKVMAKTSESRSSLHLATFGAGALLATRWLAEQPDAAKQSKIATLSLLHPSLNVHERQPRLRTPSLLPPTSIVAQSSDGAADTKPTEQFARRLSDASPTIFTYDEDNWFHRQVISRDTNGVEHSKQYGLAGYWAESWREWLLQKSAKYPLTTTF
ncbi:hypothetical protein [Shimia sp.]|uniref:hypothetical protein n=1 Tax=Shimia sp. TaxID=1954381 RepID=UPI003B8D205D